MSPASDSTITVEATLQLPVERVWELWTLPEHITRWNFASDDWRCPTAVNDLEPGGKLSWRMEAKDGSAGFDLTGVYQEIIPHKQIIYRIDDGREVVIHFADQGTTTSITETFEAEKTNPVELQRNGWQAILDNFKQYAESVG